MFGFLRNTALKGLVRNTAAKISAGSDLPDDIKFSPEIQASFVQMAVIVAHPSYPKARLGIPELDEGIKNLPPAVVDADSAGKITHRFTYYHEMTLGDCVQRLYGRSVKELMDVFNGL